MPKGQQWLPLVLVEGFRMSGPLQRNLANTVFILFTCFFMNIPGSAAQEAVCSSGFGSFKAELANGVAASVGAVPKAGFASRTCRAKLSWDKQDLVIAAEAWQIDVDAMGVDLGLGSQMIAFEIKNTDADRQGRYEIYSLKKVPKLLRTITGGGYYSAADTDLDGRIEIWTSDAAAVDGFENIPLSALEFAPSMVLRFEQKKLIDVSSEFEPHFDRQIATLRARLSSQRLNEFKGSDGALSTTSFMPLDKRHRLFTTKAEILEIVWSYLYSNRQSQAWNTLGELWPPSDLDRIRIAIQNARARGVLSQVEGMSESSSAARLKKKHAMIYDRVSQAGSQQGNPLSWDYAPGASGPGKDEHTFEADTSPVPILLRRPPPQDTSSSAITAEVTVNLVIDAAGKVRSAKAEGKAERDLLSATANWKFIPAFKGGRPVASSLQMGVTLAR